MVVARVVAADKELAHQISLAVDQKNGNAILISCNCMPMTNGGNRQAMTSLPAGTGSAFVVAAWLMARHRYHQAAFDSAAIAAARRVTSYRVA